METLHRTDAPSALVFYYELIWVNVQTTLKQQIKAIERLQ